MDSNTHSHYWKHSGSFRIKLKGGTPTGNVPKNSFVGIVGNEVCIIQGVGEKLLTGWQFTTKGESFGWDDFEIGEVTADGKIVFDERGIFFGNSGGGK